MKLKSIFAILTAGVLACAGLTACGDDKAASNQKATFTVGFDQDFPPFGYVDENGEVTDVPYDQATYMDVAPGDRCENVRREICLTLEQMARDLGYNYTYLSAYFNQRLHTGFQDFVNQYRVSHAAMLLQGSSIPVTQVAEQCGFGTIRSFNRVFLKSLGMSPSAFRKQNR